LVLTAGVLLVLLAVGLTWWLSRSHLSGGDPGGRIMRALQPDLAAVPPGSTDVRTQRLEPVWSAKCPDNPAGQAGWSDVQADASFTTALPKEKVTAFVNSFLARNGWARHDESFGPGQGPVAHWTKQLADGVQADAVVHPLPAGSTNWALTVIAHPPGFALPGC
jgi:hypothetical protein